MTAKLRLWLHRLLFRSEHYELLRVTADLADIDARYSRKVGSLWRTPHVDSQWQDKFLSLEKDYMALEKKVADSEQRIIAQWNTSADEPCYRVIDSARANQLRHVLMLIMTPDEFATRLRLKGAFTVATVPGSVVR